MNNFLHGSCNVFKIIKISYHVFLICKFSKLVLVNSHTFKIHIFCYCAIVNGCVKYCLDILDT